MKWFLTLTSQAKHCLSFGLTIVFVLIVLVTA